MKNQGRLFVSALAVGLLACEGGAARAERERAETRLAVIKEMIPAKLPIGSSRAQVMAFLAAQQIEYEKAPLPEHMIAYLGEWKGPIFRRGLHLVFYFNDKGEFTRYESREVEGS